MDKPSFYAIIPADVRYDKCLKFAARLLYGEITALCNSTGVCTAGNDYFAALYDVDDKTISRWISQLRNAGYIGVTVFNSEGNRREITIDKKVTTYGQKKHEVVTKKSRGSDQKVTPIKENITINNTINREETALAFLERIAPSYFERFCMKHKTALGHNWAAFEVDFNSKVVTEELKWEAPILIARAERLAFNWQRNESNFGKGAANNQKQQQSAAPQHGRIELKRRA